MKIFSLIVPFLFCSTICMAQSEDHLASAPVSTASAQKTSREYMLEGKVGYFYPTNDRFRDVYDGGALYGIEFNMQAWKCIYLWSEVDYFHRSGKTEIKFESTDGSASCHLRHKEGGRTHLTLVPLSVGLKYFTPPYPVRFYLGAGVLAEYLHTSTHAKHLAHKNNGWGVGGAFKSGLLFTIKEAFLINVFSDYYLIDVDLDHKKGVINHDARVSGWVWGGGLGYSF